MAVIELDFTKDTRDTLDKFRAGAGWHRGKLERFDENTEKGSYNFTFRITDAHQRGATHVEYLGNPRMATTERSQEFQNKLLKCWAARLGLVDDKDMGAKKGIDFDAAVGNEYAFEIQYKPYAKQDGTGDVDKWVIEFNLYPLDHPALTAEIRHHLGLPLLEGQVLGAAGPGKAKAPSKAKAAKQAVDVKPSGPEVSAASIDELGL